MRGGVTEQRTNGEDRATQPMEAGGWVSQKQIEPWDETVYKRHQSFERFIRYPFFLPQLSKASVLYSRTGDAEKAELTSTILQVGITIRIWWHIGVYLCQCSDNQAFSVFNVFLWSLEIIFHNFSGASWAEGVLLGRGDFFHPFVIPPLHHPHWQKVQDKALDC